MKYIYILKLKNNKWYFGTSDNVEKRIKQHLNGDGSKWTQKYKPLKTINSYKIKDLHEEDKITLQYMEKYGINNVRGGSFCNMELTDGEKQVLSKMIKTQNNKCYSCNNTGHFVKDCNNKWIDISEEDDSENETVIYNIKCYRCYRKGHMKNECYASKDIYGNSLDDDVSENETVINNIKCYRCKRTGHVKNKCYAKSDIYGNIL
jgi:cellular nucleic acid-binding protein